MNRSMWRPLLAAWFLCCAACDTEDDGDTGGDTGGSPSDDGGPAGDDGSGGGAPGGGGECDQVSPQGDLCEVGDDCSVACLCEQGVVTAGRCTNGACDDPAAVCADACVEFDEGDYAGGYCSLDDPGGGDGGAGGDGGGGDGSGGDGGSNVCMPTGDTCETNGDCCGFDSGTTLCTSFDGVFTACADTCLFDLDCVSNCCVPLEGGGSVCGPSDLCG